MVQTDLKKVVVICGPTGVGKSRIGIELARRFHGEIINADSQQVYRGLNIGTAKLSLAEQSGVPHHLIDIVSPDQHFDAARFARLADQAVGEIEKRGCRPFIVGGTGLYIRLFLKGICGAPPQSVAIRKRLEEEIVSHGLTSLHERLRQDDPVTAKVVHKNDRIRIIRALEIFELTGTPASEFYARHRFEQKRYATLKLGIDMDREELYARLDARVDAMLKKGWAEEVSELLKQYPADCQAFTAIGYRELASHLAGRLPLDLAVSLIKRHSRHYAKRQWTWFRADREINWYYPGEIEAMAGQVGSFLGLN